MRPRVIVVTVEELKKRSADNSPKVPSFTVNKPSRNITAADERAMLQDLFDNMRSDRLQHEIKMARSLEFAKGYTCKD